MSGQPSPPTDTTETRLSSRGRGRKVQSKLTYLHANLSSTPRNDHKPIKGRRVDAKGSGTELVLYAPHGCGQWKTQRRGQILNTRPPADMGSSAARRKLRCSLTGANRFKAGVGFDKNVHLQLYPTSKRWTDSQVLFAPRDSGRTNTETQVNTTSKSTRNCCRPKSDSETSSGQFHSANEDYLIILIFPSSSFKASRSPR